ncbi:MAG TPA: LPS export ABC transporter periplasmic protein LptC [Rhodocyclaceae bacterium]|nr:LPS export ABC transporter periplasmic protein LptC [Rhodocyclaceae bacterium]
MRLPGSSALFPLLILAMLAGFTWWLERASRGEGIGPSPKLRHDPDFWVEHFVVRRFGPDGNIQNTLKAARMQHFPDDDSTEVTEPQVAYFRDDQTTTATARRAWLDKGGKHVRLMEGVRLVKVEPKEPETIVETSVLDVVPDDETAHTDAPATITQGQSVIHGAGGLDVNNKARIAVLNGPVTGTIYGKKDK